MGTRIILSGRTFYFFRDLETVLNKWVPKGDILGIRKNPILVALKAHAVPAHYFKRDLYLEDITYGSVMMSLQRHAPLLPEGMSLRRAA